MKLLKLLVLFTLIAYNVSAQLIYRKGTASGTDTYTVTVTPTFTAYYEDQRFLIEFTNANTGAATININSKGAKSIVKEGGTALEADDIKAGEIKFLVYDGTNMQVVGGGGGAAVTASNGLTKTNDNITLGGALTSNVTFTGSKRITFSPGTGQGSVAGLNVGSVAGNPSSAVFQNGDMWYNSSTNKLMARINSSSVSLLNSDDAVLTGVGSGLTGVTGTVSLGGTTTGNVTLEPTTLNTSNVQIGTYNNKAYQNAFTAAERIHFYTNPHNTSSSSNDHFVVYGGSSLKELFAIDEASPMKVKLEDDVFFIGETDGSLNHFVTINPATHTFFAHMGTGVSDKADYVQTNDGFTFDINGTDIASITSSGLSITGALVANGEDVVTDNRTIAGVDLVDNITQTEMVDALLGPTASTGTDVAFDVPRTYGYSADATGNITFTTAGLVEGITQLMIHNDSSEPTFESGMVVISGTYATGVDNYIMMHAVKSNLILVTISQEQ